MDNQDKIIRISVRSLVEFLLRSGSLDTESGPSSEAAMLEGARIHRALQKKAGEGYRAEVPLRMDLPAGGALLRLEGRADGIFLSGDAEADPRVDSGSDGGGLWTIDEIKTVFRGLKSMEGPMEVHLAQARCYAYMYACREKLDRMRIRMTYCSQVTGDVRYFYEELSFADLEEWFTRLVRDYEPWIRLQLSLAEARDRTIRQMEFPFPYREGQYELAAGVYRTIVHRKKLFLQAPTGTGKTMAVLFPSLKAVGAGKAERIFYLTAKGVTGAVAGEALALLHRRGLSVRSLFLISKERACPCQAVDCRPQACPRADGHFDRVNEALWELLQGAAEGEPMTARVLAECAERHRVCPYSLSLDAAEFADVIICDYNYVFHPQARLERFFEGKNNSILLIDEAHNLLERGRDLYSAEISARQVRQFRKSIKTVWPRLWRKMKGLAGVLRALEREAAEDSSDADRRKIRILHDWAQQEQTPERRVELTRAVEEVRDQIQWILEQENRSAALYGKTEGEDRQDLQLLNEPLNKPLNKPLNRELKSAAETAEETEARDAAHAETSRGGSGGDILAEGEPAADKATGISQLLDFYFGLCHFGDMLEGLDDHYIVYTEKNSGGFYLHLYCADPSAHLSACMEGLTSAIFFSATFLPVQYYKGLLGGRPEDFEMYARSSFPPDKRKVLIVRDVTSRYRDRNEQNYARIARSIGQVVACRPGNYMVYFPSYAFLENVLEAFREIFRPTMVEGASADAAAACGSMFVLAQRREMTDPERADFLQAFENVDKSRRLVGFCVLGGMFGEGIDLRSDRLIGSLIVGTGIPPVEPRRELLRQYFAGQGRNGYDYAYRFPGMNKVLQAAGRVIRTAEDVGIVVLMDGRFGEGSNRELFPVEWGQPESVGSDRAAEVIRLFWEQYR